MTRGQIFSLLIEDKFAKDKKRILESTLKNSNIFPNFKGSDLQKYKYYQNKFFVSRIASLNKNNNSSLNVKYRRPYVI